ncbi:MAG: hypothetical protein IT210_00220 [Armatimonadetes bacterium]|nr:hypothetical protein [Armatimonadota bacterium]
MPDNARFTYRVTDGWLRDLASEPTPTDPWPCIRWDERLLEDQIRFLNVQTELGVDLNVVWGLFVDRNWPVPLENIIHDERERMLRRFVDAAHERGVKVLSGVGVYSWGFDEIIRKVPGAAAGHQNAMCAHSETAWEWQVKVLDFLMDPRWGLDGISMQSADLGRCDCMACSRLSPAQHHARLLTRSAAYVRQRRPDWIIGQASWGLRVDQPEELPYLQEISRAVDYMVEVSELSASSGRRREVVEALDCAFGSVGGVFVEPPQHWDRLRWFVPCGLGSAQALRRLHEDGGRACEYFYRPFVNPGEMVSWLAGARILSAPETMPEDALQEAVQAVYRAEGAACADLAAWYARAEGAYFSRARFEVGWGSLSLEPLIWAENPAISGPPVYLAERMSPEARAGYAVSLETLKAEFGRIAIPNREAAHKTLACIDGTLEEIRRLNGG